MIIFYFSIFSNYGFWMDFCRTLDRWLIVISDFMDCKFRVNCVFDQKEDYHEEKYDKENKNSTNIDYANVFCFNYGTFYVKTELGVGCAISD